MLCSPRTWQEVYVCTMGQSRAAEVLQPLPGMWLSVALGGEHT